MRLATLGLGLGLASCGPREAAGPAQPTAPLPAYQLGPMRVDGAPPIDPAITAALAPFARGASSRLLDISDDGTHVLALTANEVVEQKAGEGPRARVTDLDAMWAAFAPAAINLSAANDILVDADHDGDEDLHLYRNTVRIPDTGDARDRQVDPVLDRTRGRLAWAQVAPGAADYDLWLDDGTAPPRRVYRGAGTWSPLDISRDGRSILARHYASESSSGVYRIDVAAGTATELAPMSTSTPTARFGPGDRVFAIGDGGGELHALRELRPGGDRVLAQLPESAELAITDDGVIAFTTNEDGASHLFLYDLTADALRNASGVATNGVITDLVAARGAPVLAFSLSDARHQREVFTYDLRTATLAQITHGGDAPPASTLAEPTHERIDASDGVSIPLLLFLPQARTTGAPVIIDFHGGPEDQWRPRYAAFEQFLISRGYAIIQPNVRGSTGYGRAFAALDDRARRENVTALDVAAILDWVSTRPDLDAHRIAVMGTSYGGFLALSSLIAFQDRIAGAVELVGITDLASFLGGTSAYRRDQRRAEYGDERNPADRARLDAMSPVKTAGALHRPVLVAQGAHDPRVPAADAERFVAVARKAGATAWYLMAADEGHGFAKPGNRGTFEVLAAQFFDQITGQVTARGAAPATVTPRPPTAAANSSR